MEVFMFIGRRKNGIYFVEIFDPALKKINRISTGTRNKSLAQKFLSNQFSGFDTVPKDRKVHLKDFRFEYQKYVSGTYTSNYSKSIALSFSQLIQAISNPKLDSITVRHVQAFLSEVFRRSPKAAELYLSVGLKFNTTRNLVLYGSNYIQEMLRSTSHANTLQLI